jgi:DNA-binding GntR family transcriptional regulator
MTQASNRTTSEDVGARASERETAPSDEQRNAPTDGRETAPPDRQRNTRPNKQASRRTAERGTADRRARAFIAPLEQQSTPSIIAEKLRLAIGYGELAAGDQLYEAELARELGVSRGPLREAVQRLTQEGLVVAFRNRGVFVVEMTPERVRDMYLARAAVERAAAEQILVTGDGAAAAATLRTVVDAMRSAQRAGDIAQTTEADMRFHQTLVDLAHSPRLARMHSTLLTETRMCITALEDSYRFDDDRVREHRGIADALEHAPGPVTRASRERTEVDRLLIAHMEDAIARLSFDGARTDMSSSSGAADADA